MGTVINKLTIRGYKSIRELVDFELRPVNVLIGANGAGKSNFVSFFRMLRAMADEGLNAFAREQGGADGFFFQGIKVTPTLSAELTFGVNAYQFMLAPTAESGLMFKSEYAAFRDRYKSINHGAAESALKQRRTESGVSAEKGVCHYVYEAVSSWTVYHFPRHQPPGRHAPGSTAERPLSVQSRCFEPRRFSLRTPRQPGEQAML